MDYALDQGVNFWDTADYIQYHLKKKLTVKQKK